MIPKEANFQKMNPEIDLCCLLLVLHRVSRTNLINNMYSDEQWRELQLEVNCSGAFSKHLKTEQTDTAPLVRTVKVAQNLKEAGNSGRETAFIVNITSHLMDFSSSLE